MSFLQPHLLWLLLALPIWLFWYLGYYRRQRVRILLTYQPQSGSGERAGRRVLQVLQPLCTVVALALLTIAMAQPVRWEARKERKPGGLQLLLMLDVSESMKAEDMRPTRLEVAKTAVTQLIDLRPHDQVGLGIFGAGALSYVPLTHDHAYVKERIQYLQVGILPADATSLGDGLGWGINRMEESAATGDKVLLLVTDGGNNAGNLDPVATARYARKRRIRTYVLSLSNPGLGAEWPDAAKARSDHAYLESLALAGGGVCVSAAAPEALFQLAQSLESLRASDATDTYLQEPVALHTPLLWTALGLLVTMALLQYLWLANPLED
ncbi:MAG: VWA domain-containing protein [Bacteroidetes bacterium]|nr:VWA domain-containing protein [Bacteroidota bacterium]